MQKAKETSNNNIFKRCYNTEVRVKNTKNIHITTHVSESLISFQIFQVQYLLY